MTNNRKVHCTTLGLAIQALACVLLALPGCGEHERVPSSDYSNLDPDASKEWEVTSIDRTYRVRRFTVSDSTLILQDVLWVENRERDGYLTGARGKLEPSELPIVLRFEDVRSVRSVEPLSSKEYLGITTGVLVFVLVFALFALTSIRLFDS